MVVGIAAIRRGMCLDGNADESDETRRRCLKTRIDDEDHDACLHDAHRDEKRAGPPRARLEFVDLAREPKKVHGPRDHAWATLFAGYFAARRCPRVHRRQRCMVSHESKRLVLCVVLLECVPELPDRLSVCEHGHEHDERNTCGEMGGGGTM